MKTIKIDSWHDIPRNFTGKVIVKSDYADLYCINYRFNGLAHNISGPAYEYWDNSKEYWINGKWICNNNELKFSFYVNLLRLKSIIT